MSWVPSESVDAETARWVTGNHIRFSGFEVLCSGCGGLGCDLCEPEPEPEQRRPLWKRLLRKR